MISVSAANESEKKTNQPSNIKHRALCGAHHWMAGIQHACER